MTVFCFYSSKDQGKISKVQGKLRQVTEKTIRFLFGGILVEPTARKVTPPTSTVIIGVPIGLTLALLPKTERIVEPYLAAINASPRTALAPVFLVIFGLSQSAKVALGFSIAIFVMIVNSRAGVENVDPDWRALMRASGATRRQFFMKILLPAAIPAIFAGVRLAMIYSLLGVVSSELIASTNGMGKLIAQYSSVFQMDRVYALIIIMVLIAAFLNNVASLIERRLTRWKFD